MDNNIIKQDTNSDERDDPTSNIAPTETYSRRDINFISLKGFFNVEDPTIEDEDAMNYIMGTFEEMGARNMSDILLSIKNIEMRLGVTPLGVGRHIAVKNYLKLSNNIAEMQKQQQALER